MASYLMLDDSGKWLGIQITCVCGSFVKAEWAHELDYEHTEGNKVKCKGCKFIYEVEMDECGMLYFRLL